MPSRALTDPYRRRHVSGGGLAVSSRAAWQIGQHLKRTYNQYRKPAPKRQRASATKAMPKRMSSGKSYNTLGRLGKKFRAPKKTPTSVYLKKGWVEAVESGGEISSIECPYIGHGLGHFQVFKAAVAAIVRNMLQNMSYRIASWDDSIVQVGSGASPGGFRITYRSAVGGPFLVSSGAFGIDETWQGIVDAIFLAMKTVIGGLNVETVTFDELIFYQTTDLGSQLLMARSRVFINDVMLDFNCDTHIAIQNRTVASSVGTDGDVYSKDNILNNPLGGKVYEGSGTGTQLREESNTALLAANLVAQADTGVILMDSQTVGLSAAQTKILKRPPAKTAFTRVQKAGSCSLAPGQIRTSNLYWKRKITFCKLCTLLFPSLRSTNTGSDLLVPLGSFRFYGFEKKCNTRVNEGSIELGYECNAVYRCRVTMMTRGVAVVNNVI